jgi:predicted porin
MCSQIVAAGRLNTLLSERIRLYVSKTAKVDRPSGLTGRQPVGRNMNLLKSIVMAGGASLTLAMAAQAADVPTKKEAPPAAPAKVVSCTGFWDFLSTSCPLTYYGVTLYGTVDVGYGWEQFGAPFNPLEHTAVDYLIGKPGRPNIWLPSPNALSQSNVGVKGKFDLAPGWSFVGQAETGYDPYSLELANGIGAQRQNNNLPLRFQSSNQDSSRAGQALNSQYFGGISSTAFGTLTYGRQNTLLLDGVNAYDPMGGSYAFSVIGFSGTTAGTGDTEDARSNLAFKYRVTWNNYRAAAMVQTGGFAQSNASDALYQFQLGGDFYGFSVDGIASRVVDAVAAGTFNGPTPAGIPTDTLRATISNNTSGMALVKYKWNQLTLYGGYEYILFEDPTSEWAQAGNLFTGIDGGPMQNRGNQFLSDRRLQVFWTGAKYAVTPDLDITGAYYHLDQNNFNITAVRHCSDTSSAGCSGTEDAISFLIDYRIPVAKKFDVYGGVMWSEVRNGLANGFQPGGAVNVDPTIGLRFRF